MSAHPDDIDAYPSMEIQLPTIDMGALETSEAEALPFPAQVLPNPAPFPPISDWEPNGTPLVPTGVVPNLGDHPFFANHVEMRPNTPVGDLNSTARGSGARMNSGKLPLELIPARVLHQFYAARPHAATAAEECGQLRALACLEHLADWQDMRSAHSLVLALQALGQPVTDAAWVFDYGRKKYAAWNWAKGMAWSVPFACALRHLTEGILAGYPNDDESGRPHEGHVACNIIMLMTFVRSYPEGDDMCPVEYLKVPQ